MTWEKLPKGYKYRLTDDMAFDVDVVGHEADTDWVELDSDGVLTLSRGYAWDGATMAFDVDSFRLASAAHDALYGLIRGGYISQDCRKDADRTMKRLAKEGGMGWWRHVRYVGVRLFGGLVNRRSRQ